MRPSVYGLVAVLLAASYFDPYVFGEDAGHAQVAFTHSGVPPALDILAGKANALERDTFHIFNSVHHLLRQWGNTISPNGFSFTRGTIPAGTTLYHARGDAEAPSSPDFLAFDAEMSYAIMIGRCNIFMRTYRTARQLNILYIDGNSASITGSGTLDSQDILMYGFVKPDDHTTIFGEFVRAGNLCAWGQPRGIDGFVRQNTGFELVKCAFEDGLTLMQNLNVTAWAASFDPERSSRLCFDIWPPDVPQNWTKNIDVSADALIHDLALSRASERGNPSGLSEPPSSLALPNKLGGGDPPPERYPGPPVHGRHTERPEMATAKPKPPFTFPGLSTDPPFIKQNRFEWARAAAAVYNGPGEYRVKLDTGTFVTAYGRSGLSGVDSPNTTDHRLVNMTRAVAADLRSDIEAFFTPQSPLFQPESGRNIRALTGINWRDVTDQIVSRYGDRLPELFNYLNEAASALGPTSSIAESNANETRISFESARILVSLLLVPHHDLSAGVSRDDNLRNCVGALVPSLDGLPLYASEGIIAEAVKRTQHEICRTLLSVHEELSKATPIEAQTPQVLKKAAGTARNRVSELMNKLRWTSWKSCDRKCGHDEICLIALWPLFGFDAFDSTMQDPKCANAANWMDDLERRRKAP